MNKKKIIIKDLIKKNKAKKIAISYFKNIEEILDLNFKKLGVSSVFSNSNKVRNLIKKKIKKKISFDNIDIFFINCNYLFNNFFFIKGNNFSKEKILMDKSKNNIVFFNKKKKNSISMYIEVMVFSKKNFINFFNLNNINFLIVKNKKKILFTENNFILFKINLIKKTFLFYLNLIKNINGYLNNSIYYINNKTFIYEI
ncbi:hypothetical protein [Candidatus Vidania fulgoroideorum]